MVKFDDKYNDQTFIIPRTDEIKTGVKKVYDRCLPANRPDGVEFDTAVSVVTLVCGEMGDADGEAELTATQWFSLLAMVDHVKTYETGGFVYRSDEVEELRRTITSSLRRER